MLHHVAYCKFKTTPKGNTVLTLATSLKNKTLVQLGFQEVDGNVRCFLSKQKAENAPPARNCPCLESPCRKRTATVGPASAQSRKLGISCNSFGSLSGEDPGMSGKGPLRNHDSKLCN